MERSLAGVFILIRIARFTLPYGAFPVALLCLHATAAPPDSITRLDTMIITGTRLPTLAGSANRTLTILTREDIAALPAGSIHDVLEHVAGIDLRRRGVGAVQADLSIRGGTFEQAVIMVDGMRMTDPQTGHHNLDIPVHIDDIERIELLHGHGADIYGAGALSGAVNIVTRRPRKTRAEASATVGHHELVSLRASASCPLGPTAHTLTASRALAEGYRPNTDFSTRGASLHSTIDLRAADISLTAGYGDKNFGANGFYAGSAGEREQTTSMLTLLKATTTLGPVTFRPGLFWRRHLDDFTLDYTVPDSYRNKTRTECFGGEINAFAGWFAGMTSVAFEGAREAVASDDLDRHDRNRAAAMVEHRIRLFSRFSIVPGVSISYYTRWGMHVWPGINLGLDLRDAGHLYGNAGRSFRAPSFTELYYDSPANRGNPDLLPEEALAVEFGHRGTWGIFSTTIAGHYRTTANAIDWIRHSGGYPWVVSNIDRLDAAGTDAGVRVKPAGAIRKFLRSLDAGYFFLHMERTATGAEKGYAAEYYAVPPHGLDIIYKYGMHYLAHKVSFGLDHAVYKKLCNHWRFRIEKREGAGSALPLLDSRTYLKHGPVEIFIEGLNLFDRRYEDNQGIVLPGRWFRGGITAALGPLMSE
ncbi:MAG: TonB-dependent receptor [Chitinivibrionales bacterium]|nr:TonB-dependent receptor [Chitinivibrionales bacterium]MBD3394843.1 TonB-dependent receptor [Chitinivibrionales bacterium]